MTELIISELNSLIVEAHDQTVIPSLVVKLLTCNIAGTELIVEVNGNQGGGSISVWHLVRFEHKYR